MGYVYIYIYLSLSLSLFNWNTIEFGEFAVLEKGVVNVLKESRESLPGYIHPPKTII